MGRVWYRFLEGDDPKVFEAKLQVHVIFTWVLSLVAGDVTPLLEAKIQKKRNFALVQTPLTICKVRLVTFLKIPRTDRRGGVRLVRVLLCLPRS